MMTELPDDATLYEVLIYLRERGVEPTPEQNMYIRECEEEL